VLLVVVVVIVVAVVVSVMVGETRLSGGKRCGLVQWSNRVFGLPHFSFHEIYQGKWGNLAEIQNL